MIVWDHVHQMLCMCQQRSRPRLVVLYRGCYTASSSMIIYVTQPGFPWQIVVQSKLLGCCQPSLVSPGKNTLAWKLSPEELLRLENLGKFDLWLGIGYRNQRKLHQVVMVDLASAPNVARKIAGKLDYGHLGPMVWTRWTKKFGKTWPQQRFLRL